MKRQKIKPTGVEWYLIKRSDRKNVSIKYRSDSRSPWAWGSSGVTTKKEARRLAPGLVQQWLADTSRDCDRWQDFRERYESEFLAGGKPKTAEAFRTAANRLESLCPVRFIQDLDESHFSKFAKKLRDERKAPATIQAYRDHLMSALDWAATLKIIKEKPKPPQISGGAAGSRGTPLMREQAELIAMNLPEIVGEVPAKQWAWNLEALWRSGFRIGETFAFTWEPSEFHYIINIDDRRPMIGIAAEHEKGGKVRLLPIAPDFAYLLRAVPKRQRFGQVFKWPGMRGGEVSKKTVEKRIAAVGKLAGVVVGQTSNGQPRYATAQDFRRSFGARWATKIMPPVLQAMMRHECIETTMKYYVGENATRNADAVWGALGADFGDKLGDTLDSLFASEEISHSTDPVKHGEN